MDNCWRENKNKIVFGWIYMLIKMEWFEEVEMYFLPVGHTHSELDRAFVEIAKGKNFTSLHSPIAFEKEFIPKVYKHVNKERWPKTRSPNFIFGWRIVATSSK